MRATMSKVSALRECQFWARPEAQWVYTPAGPAAEFGTAVHAEIAGQVSGTATVATDDQAVRAAAESVVTWWQNQRDQHDRWHAEPAYVLDVERGRARHVGDNIGRSYPRVGPFEMAGSADIVGLSHAVASVYDVKTGRPENVEPVSDNAQLRTLALAVHLAHGVDRVRVGLVFPTASSGPVVEEHEYDALDLAAWQAELAALVDAVPTSVPRPSKSACRYCPAKQHCPAMTSALAEVTPPRRLPIVMDAAEIQSPEHAREQYLALRALKTGVDEAWAALRRYAEEHGPVSLGDGKVYGSRQTTRESIDLGARAAADVLRAELGSDEAFRTAVSLETSKTAIKSAAREVAKATGEKAAAVERRVLEALRATGAVKVSTSTTWDEMNEGA